MSHGVNGGLEGCVSMDHKVKGCGSSWEEAKKYKSEVGSWQNFSLDEPMDGKGALSITQHHMGQFFILDPGYLNPAVTTHENINLTATFPENDNVTTNGTT